MDSTRRKRAKAAGIHNLVASILWGGEPVGEDLPVHVESDAYGNRSRYNAPHQGPRECERRRRQMAAGTHGH